MLCVGDVAKQGDSTPTVREGFMSLPKEPYEIYKCSKIEFCPAGTLGTCPNGRIGISCAQCPEAQAVWLEGCVRCAETSWATYFLVVLLLFVGIPVYHFTNGPLVVNTDFKSGLAVVLSVAINFVQVVATFFHLSVPWPRTVGSSMSATQWALLDIDFGFFGCLVGGEPMHKYATRVSAVYMAIAAMLCLYGLSHPVSHILSTQLHRDAKHWSFNKVANTIGYICQLFFVALVGISVVPFQCYAHPTGEMSVLDYPAIICGSSNQVIMLVLSFAMLATFNIPFLCVVLWANCTATRHTTREYGKAPPHHVRFRFLFGNFRPDVWWWGSVFSVRQVLLAIAPSIAINDPSVQVVFVISVLAVYIGLVCSYHPWRTTELNILDALSCIVLLLFIAAQSCFMPVTTSKYGMEVFMLTLLAAFGIFCLILALVGTVGAMLVWGHDGEFGIPYPRVAGESLSTFSSNFHKACQFVARLDADRCNVLLKSMNYSDRRLLDMTLASLRAYSRENLHGDYRRLEGLINNNARFYTDKSLALGGHWRKPGEAISGNDASVLEEDLLAACVSDGQVMLGSPVQNPGLALELRQADMVEGDVSHDEAGASQHTTDTSLHIAISTVSGDWSPKFVRL
jgi:hypothetical protein